MGTSTFGNERYSWMSTSRRTSGNRAVSTALAGWVQMLSSLPAEVVPSFAALRTYFEFDAEGGTDTFEEGLDFFFIDGVRARLARLER